MGGRAESLVATFDETDREKERPPSGRTQKTRQAAASSVDAFVGLTSALSAPKSSTPPGNAPPAPALVATPATASVPTLAPEPAPPAAICSGDADPLAAFADTCVLLYTSMARDQVCKPPPRSGSLVPCDHHLAFSMRSPSCVHALAWQLATVATRKIVTQLEGMQVGFHKLDGTVPENRDVRNALWTLAGAKPGTYPIVYDGQTGFVCQGDELQDLIDCGELEGTLSVAKRPSVAGTVHVPAPAVPPPAIAPISTSSASRLAKVVARLTKLAGLQPHMVAAAAGSATASVLMDDLATTVASLELATSHLILDKLSELTGRLEQATSTLSMVTTCRDGNSCAAQDTTAQLEAIVIRMEAAVI